MCTAIKKMVQEGRRERQSLSNIFLILFDGETGLAVSLIQAFWKVHNGEELTVKEAKEDLRNWTKIGHLFYFIEKDKEKIGFVHIGSRGGEIDWLEDIFVLREFQGQGIGSKAIQLTESMVRQYSEAFYIEVAARNFCAIQLYEKMGFDCLNTLTLRKDFDQSGMETIGTEHILGKDFEIRKCKK